METEQTTIEMLVAKIVSAMREERPNANRTTSQEILMQFLHQLRMKKVNNFELCVMDSKPDFMRERCPSLRLDLGSCSTHYQSKTCM
jgi:hypothetical protein